MATEEVCLPRGGPPCPSRRAEHPSERQKKKKETLFGGSTAVAQKKQRRRHKERRNVEDEPKEEAFVIRPLTAHSMTEGVVLLGCVQLVHDFGLKVSLPYGLVGNVALNEVSQIYTGLLQKFAHGVEDDDTAVVRMSAMFRVGQPVVCKVLSVSPEMFGSGRLSLTLDPQKVNSGVVPAAVCAGTVIQCVVVSNEDYGYTMDCGVRGLEAFLPHDETRKYLKVCNDEQPLAVGQLLRCLVLSVMGRTLRLSVNPKRLQSPQDVEEASLDSLLPGMRAKLTVTRVKPNGLGVMWQTFEGYVHRTHLSQTWDLPPNYSVGQEVVGILLYVHPSTREPHWTLKAVGRWQPPEGLSVGALVRDAQVVGADTWGAHLELPGGKVRALVARAHAAETEVDDARNAVTVGRKCKCRIIAYNMIDCVAVATLKKSSLKGVHLAPDMLTLGMKLEGKVHRVLPSGIVVSIGPWMRGFVAQVHLGGRAFEVGQPVRCRLLQVEAHSDPPRLWFTCHRGLLTSRRPPLCYYSEAVPDKIADGLVVQAVPAGLLVAFYGHVRGWVPAMEIHRTPVPLVRQYKFGQLVTCRVVRFEPDSERLTLSLKLKTRDETSEETLSAHAAEEADDALQQQEGRKRNWSESADNQETAWVGTEDTTGAHTSGAEARRRSVRLLKRKEVPVDVSLKTGDEASEETLSAHAVEEADALQPQEGTAGVGTEDTTGAHTPKAEARRQSVRLLKRKKVPDDDKSAQRNGGADPEDTPKTLPMSFVPGEESEATVVAVEKFQLKVSLPGGISARVHITLVEEAPAEGVNPMQQFNVGDKVCIYVTCLRTRSNWYVMPITDNKTRIPLELSLFKTSGIRDLQPGTPITGFYSHFADNCIYLVISTDRMAKLPILNMDIPASKIPFVSKQYKRGQAVMATVFEVYGDGTVELSQIGIDVLQPGQIVNALVATVRDTRGAMLSLPLGYRGQMGLTDFCDDFTKTASVMEDLVEARYTKCQIVGFNPQTMEYYVSMRKSRLQGSTEVIDREVKTVDDISVGDTLRGFVCSRSGIGYFVNVGFHVDGLVPRSALPAVGTDDYRALHVGALVVVNVASLCRRTGKLALTLIKTLSSSCVYRKRKVSETEDPTAGPRKRRASETEASTEQPKEPPRLDLAEGFTWDVAATPNLSELAVMAPNTKDEDSDDEEEKPGRRKSRKEMRDERQKMEAELRQRERALMDPTREPETVDDFDRLVLASPNSSMVWLRYMAFHLRQAEVEKARAVGRRALSVIGFREETEKLNVWKGLLTLENTYGTKETLQEVLKEALQCNDCLTVYKHLMQIYAVSSKNEEAEGLLKKMLSKYKSDEVYLLGGTFYMKWGKLEEARALLERALKTLEKHEHVGLISKFAQMEFKYGDPERGKSMFDTVLVNYPKRTDLWLVYIDLLIKQGDLQGVRNLFMKATTSKFQPKKMKVFFKRWLDFEKEHGEESSVQDVRQRAVKYVEQNSAIEN
ncbi:protein RRP5 homolog [Ornithodoros turicata]|uniref:protein RRP5 homolog n=1 Tax=Ornithodoros turicata TaxID=34597 RepID=UPI0031392984